MVQAAVERRMVGYGRISTGSDQQLDSLEHQMEFFQKFAQDRCYQLIRVYADEGISGKQLKHRDQFQAMLSHAERGEFDVVVVKDVSRFARNTVDLLNSIRRLKGMGINTLFVNNNQQTLGESEFVITLLGAMAQEESANLSRRVKFGKTMTAQKGRVPRRVLGYDRVDNYTLTVNPEEAELVREIFSLYIDSGYGMSRIAARLRASGIRTLNGCLYTEAYIRRILTNPLYTGELINHKSETIDFIEGTRRSLPDCERFHHLRPELAIITPQRFAAAQAIRSKRNQDQQKGGRRYTGQYPLSGLVHCAQCGRTLFHSQISRSNGTVDCYWRCPNGTRSTGTAPCTNGRFFRDDVLRQAVSSALCEIVGDAASFLENRLLPLRYGNPVPNQNSLQRVLLHKKAALLKKRAKYLQMFEHDIISISELKEQTELITQQVQALDRRLDTLSSPCPTPAACLERTLDAFLSLSNSTNQDLRQIIRQIDVNQRGEISIHFQG